MAITIKDIAKKVGVNPSTVSRVINGNASISEDTKKKIFEAMKELDYHPNILGRSLVNGSTFTIGLVIDTGNLSAFSNTFFIQSVAAMEVVAEKQGYNLLLTSEKGNKNTVKELILGHKADGIILPAKSLTEELLNLLRETQFPFVVMGEAEKIEPEVLWVDMDNEQGGQLAVRHLLEQGYQHPVLFVGDRTDLFEQKRISGFQKEMAAEKKEYDITDIVECGSEKEAVMKNIQDFLRKEKRWDSIICTNNIVAYYALAGLKEKGIKVPEETGILTFDNYPLAEYLEPALSVVEVDTYKLGENAAAILFEKIKGSKKNCSNTLISTKIIPRASTQR